jgi:hypothetical protein
MGLSLVQSSPTECVCVCVCVCVIELVSVSEIPSSVVKTYYPFYHETLHVIHFNLQRIRHYRHIPTSGTVVIPK